MKYCKSLFLKEYLINLPVLFHRFDTLELRTIRFIDVTFRNSPNVLLGLKYLIWIAKDTSIPWPEQIVLQTVEALTQLRWCTFV